MDIINKSMRAFTSAENEKDADLDADYPVSHLNKGCAHALLGLHTTSQDQADEEFAIATAEALIARRKARESEGLWEKTLTDAYTLNGIIEAIQGNNDKANELFEEALKITPKNHLATINQNILNDTKSEAEDIAQRSGSGKEMIDGAKIDDIQINRKDIRDTLDQARSHFVRLIAKRLDHSRLMINHVSEGIKEHHTSFHLTDDNYEGITALWIRIGDSLETIEKKYGRGDKFIELGQGAWLIYKKQNIIFQLNEDGILIRWCVFKQVI